MRGLIKKDLYVLANNKKTLLVMALMTVFFVLANGPEMASMVPIIVVLMSISSFSYDDYNGFNIYGAAMPNGRKKIVQAKYLSVCLLTLAGVVFSALIVAVVGSGSYIDNMTGVLASLMVILIMVAFLYPIIFKYGVEKGRIAMALSGIVISAAVILLTRFITITPTVETILMLEKYLPVGLTLATVLSWIVSYFISMKIFINKEL